MDEWANIFFFQAEDGIRDKLVTGVQTCALPISVEEDLEGGAERQAPPAAVADVGDPPELALDLRKVPELRRADVELAHDVNGWDSSGRGPGGSRKPVSSGHRGSGERTDHRAGRCWRGRRESPGPRPVKSPPLAPCRRPASALC